MLDRMARWLGLIILLLGGARAARADCALPESYSTEAVGSTVFVCLQGRGTETGPLLRQPAGGGSVVRVASSCILPSPDGGAESAALAAALDDDAGTLFLADGCCFVDDCVPPGSYRYGLATPIACPNGCGNQAEYWFAATVTSPDAGCASQATAYSEGAPWPSSGEQTRACGGCGCSTTGSVLGFDAGMALLAAALLRLRRRR